MSAPPVLRDSSGRFQPGTVGGPGRKPRRDLRAILETDGENVDGGLAEVSRALFTLAKSGDVAAAGLLLRHLVVAPATAIELDVAHEGGDRSTEDTARELMSILAVAAAGSDRLAAQLACTALRSAPSAQLRELAAGLAARYPDPQEVNHEAQ